MEKKILIQIVLYLLLFSLIILIFNTYKQYTNKKSLDKLTSIKNIEEKNQNIIKDIKYLSSNSNGDQYELTANIGEINFENPDLIFMTNVKGVVKLINDEKIIIIANFANFNKKTFETKFFDSVKITRFDEIITSDELYIVLEASKEELKKNPQKEQNLIRLSKNVIYNKPGYLLKTDIVEIDLITKNSKIFMNENDKKVKVNIFN